MGMSLSHYSRKSIMLTIPSWIVTMYHFHHPDVTGVSGLRLAFGLPLVSTLVVGQVVPA